MSASRAWDRAGSLPVPVAGRRLPELAAMRDELPSLDELFTFMRDAELRFATLRMRLEERSWTARGEEVLIHDVSLRHPGEAKVLTSVPVPGTTDGYETWVSDGTTVLTYVASRKVGTRRPVRPMVRGVTDNDDLPGRSGVYVPLTALQMETLPDLFVHPGGYCQNVLATGDCRVVGSTTVAGRVAIVLECDHPRTIEVTADRPDFAIRVTVDRLDGVILRLEESIGGQTTRDAIVTSYVPDAPLPPSAFAFTFPPDATVIY
jgi:outer membrane lipoprotein-sorting protein